MLDILSFTRGRRRNGVRGSRARHHCIISGTGRAGTSFLVQLLTYLGLDTGFTEDTLVLDKNARAGLELNILSPTAPYIVKNPWLCDTIRDVLEHGEIVIDYAFIPYRDLEAASKSRAYVQQLPGAAVVGRGVPGGLWHTDEPSLQQQILAEQFFKLVHRSRQKIHSPAGGAPCLPALPAMSGHRKGESSERLCALVTALGEAGVPMTFLSYPRLAKDSRYTYEKMAVLMTGVSYPHFEKIFDKVSRPDLIHQFTASDC